MGQTNKDAEREVIEEPIPRDLLRLPLVQVCVAAPLACASAFTALAGMVPGCHLPALAVGSPGCVVSVFLGAHEGLEPVVLCLSPKCSYLPL